MRDSLILYCTEEERFDQEDNTSHLAEPFILLGYYKEDTVAIDYIKQFDRHNRGETAYTEGEQFNVEVPFDVCKSVALYLAGDDTEKETIKNHITNGSTDEVVFILTMLKYADIDLETSYAGLLDDKRKAIKCDSVTDRCYRLCDVMIKLLIQHNKVAPIDSELSIINYMDEQIAYVKIEYAKYLKKAISTSKYQK